jgi:hypothetical protein
MHQIAEPHPNRGTIHRRNQNPQLDILSMTHLDRIDS